MANHAQGASAPVPSVFSFQSLFNVRVLSDAQGMEWFVLADVCKAVDYSNPSDAQKLIDVDDLEKFEVIDSLSRVQTAWCCTEPGLYQFLGSSQVEKAKPFRKWVFGEVLPAIRRQGFYGQPVSIQDQTRLETQLGRYLDRLESCNCAFSKKLTLDRIGVICRQLRQPLPDISLIGKDPKQTALEGF
ncbi:BRO family, N-terminal domain [Methylomagnum ishizawai]|uniref:BRO family, N-terminal domain n=1 Tax=Methylomagnum ishizawai TaxID=1760988 RepID=A0A1Y6CZQ5_9GAMM|nr:BRO family protein [Methylomagnum ishizawai]SMF96168.1 BRO family, N-terminal domain [Methylomagnum ishizawai]